MLCPTKENSRTRKKTENDKEVRKYVSAWGRIISSPYGVKREKKKKEKKKKR